MFTAVRLARAISLLICLGIVAAITYWVGQLIAPRVAIAPSTIAVAPGENPGGQAQWTGQMFGTVPTVATGNITAAITNMTLQGLLSGTRPAAVISVDGKPGRPYGIGEEVQIGVKIRSISSEQVVVDRNGETVTLLAPPKRTTDILSSNAGNSRGVATTAQPPASPMPLSVPAPAATQPVPAFGAAATPTQVQPAPISAVPLGASNSPPADVSLPGNPDPGKASMRSGLRPEPGQPGSQPPPAGK